MNIENEYIKDIDELVPRPDIALEVMSLSHDVECDIPKLSETIKQDPSLTANMLKMANSAFFGHMSSINSITDIIVRLGLDTVKLFAITGASVGFLKTPQESYNLEPGALWRHSYATALFASIIGKHANCDDVSGLYSAALLHDIGKIVLNKQLQIEITNNPNYNHDANITVYEQSLLNTDHAKVGQALLVKWGLPETITSPTGLHHDKKIFETDDLNCKIVYIANILSENIGIGAEEPDENIFDRSAEELEIDFNAIPNLQNNLEAIINEFHEKFNKDESFNR